jgi:hypothetical protein
MTVNPFEQDGNWYRANLHTHTHASDGGASLEERVHQYVSNGYSVLAVTDHGVCQDAARVSTVDFVVVEGIEVDVRPDGDAAYHLVCLNVPHELTVPATTDANDVIAWAKAEGGETIIAHPYWCGNDCAQLRALRGCVAIEIFNATCQRIGKGYSTVHWDNLLDMGVRVGGVAVDDAHAGRPPAIDLFGGWVMLKLQDLTVPAVMDALRTGCYYSSSGPDIVDFGVHEGTVHVNCTAVQEIHLMAANSHGTSCYAGDGRAITSAQVEIRAGWKYVRAEIVDSAGRRAWSNPIFL